jgi:hypothetical protein
MLREFAVEPESLSSWYDCRSVTDRFVMGSGALISEYPKRWRKMVYECALGKCREVELKRIVERLQSLDRRLVLPSRRDYPDTDQPWIDKAIHIHQETPFGGIICAKDESAAPSTDVISASDVGPNHRLFSGLGQAHVIRNSSEMVGAVRLLLTEATHLKLIDAHYKPGTSTGFDGPMRGLLEQVRVNEGQQIKIELHTESSSRRPADDYLEEGFANLVREVIPNADITVVLYDQGALHNRFLLTDRGGVMWGTGLDEQGNSDRKTDSDDLFLLNQKLYEFHWAKWST